MRGRHGGLSGEVLLPESPPCLPLIQPCMRGGQGGLLGGVMVGLSGSEANNFLESLTAD